MRDLLTEVALWSLGALFLLFIAVVFWSLVENAIENPGEVRR